MRRLILFIFLLFIGQQLLAGFGRKHVYRGPARTEGELLGRVLTCLKHKDTVSYFYLFPPFDTMWGMVIKNDDKSPEAQKELAQLRQHPTILIDLDPYYNNNIIARFAHVLGKGEDSGIQWSGIVMQRYELHKAGITRGLEGLHRIAPERFTGYMFVRDLLTSSTYCITVAEIQKVNGYYVGGQVFNVLEARTYDEFIDKEIREREWKAKKHNIGVTTTDDKKDSSKTALNFPKDTLASLLSAEPTAAPPVSKDKVDSVKYKRNLLLSTGVVDDDPNKMRKEVVDRKYYKGKFDEEIPVELYVRYMKDAKGRVNNWDALYKFGDMPKYVKMDVSKDNDGKWQFEEAVAVLELELSGKIYTGSWTNGITQTGYEAELNQVDLSQKKSEELDYILENKTWAKSSDQRNIDEDIDRGYDRYETKRERKIRLKKEREKAERDKRKLPVRKPEDTTMIKDDATTKASTSVKTSVKDSTMQKVNTVKPNPDTKNVKDTVKSATVKPIVAPVKKKKDDEEDESEDKEPKVDKPTNKDTKKNDDEE